MAKPRILEPLGSESLRVTGFGPQLSDLIEGEQLDLGKAESWQRLVKLIAKNWQHFEQSPVATWNMVTKCGEMVLKCRLVEKKAGGQDEDKSLQELQALFDQLTAVEMDTAELPYEMAANDDEGEEDEDAA